MARDTQSFKGGFPFAQKFHVYGLMGKTKVGWLRGVGPRC